jgi:hypothetical protein
MALIMYSLPKVNGEFVYQSPSTCFRSETTEWILLKFGIGIYNWGLIPSRAGFFCSSHCPDRFWGPPDPMGTRG